MKNLIVIFTIVAVILIGVGYSLVTSPDYAQQKLFAQALKGFAEKAGNLQREFLSRQNLAEQQLSITVNFEVLLGERVNQIIKAEVFSQRVVLRFSEQSPLFSGQSVILEPVVDNQTVRWKCINGDVVTRVRTKNCRTGVGETLDSMLQL